MSGGLRPSFVVLIARAGLVSELCECLDLLEDETLSLLVELEEQVLDLRASAVAVELGAVVRLGIRAVAAVD